MAKVYYTSERNVQILISLLKAHHIRKVIVSPGTTNITFVASIQNDLFFEVYSCVDERSAAYMACGLAEESGEPVVLTCTGATASRNYIPALTEAFYRKIPILAITATQDISKVGNLVPQVIDRSQPLKDIVKYSTHIYEIRSTDEENDTILKINRAILELSHRGSGPVHINLTTKYSRDYSLAELPPVRTIRRFSKGEQLPKLDRKKRIAIFIGSHRRFSNRQISAMDSFCERNNAVVFCDHTSGYHGRFRINFSIVNSQDQYFSPLNHIDVLIHIGEVSGDYPNMRIQPNEVWRVNTDGELRDLFRKLTNVFEMDEESFFEAYSKDYECIESTFLNDCLKEIETTRTNIPELPFSNAWIAKETASEIPANSVLHLGILNSLRVWNFFDLPDTVHVSSNTGGFGIDGDLSSLIGASLANPDILHYMVIGDLAFFYDMNVTGNRHISNNIRILLINNGIGAEFKMYSHPGYQFGKDADKYIAAGNHFGCKSPDLVKHLAEDLGFEYLTADDKESYLHNLPRFFDIAKHERPLLFEIFTDSKLESQAVQMICNIVKMPKESETNIKEIVKKVIGAKGVEIVKKTKERIKY